MITIHKTQDFLTQEESDTLLETVYSLRDKWKHVSQMPIAKQEFVSQFPKEIVEHASKVMENMNFLGEGIYILNNELSSIDADTQKILLHKFGWLYDKTIEYFKSLYNTPNVKLHESLPIPGFHIFSGTPQERREFDWHTDGSVIEHVPNVDQSTIASFVVLVQSPEDSAHLEYKMWNATIPSILTYEKNAFHIWNGNLTHRIGAFILNENEARITFQGHVYLDKNDNYYKLYF